MPQTAKLFQNGRSQAVRLPAEFRFEGREVLIRRDGRTGDVILSPKTPAEGGWEKFFASRDRLAASGELDDFVLERDDRPAERDDPLG
jgi:antitoxin VapB